MGVVDGEVFDSSTVRLCNQAGIPRVGDSCRVFVIGEIGDGVSVAVEGAGKGVVGVAEGDIFSVAIIDDALIFGGDGDIVHEDIGIVFVAGNTRLLGGIFEIGDGIDFVGAASGEATAGGPKNGK